MINHEYSELFNKNSIDKQLVITFNGGQLTNTELHQQNFELTESICSDSELRFGRCEAAEVKFKISNRMSMRNKEIDIKVYLNGDRNNPFSYGKYKVYSDKLTADKMFREIIAYDKLREILNENVADWYNSLRFPMSLNQFRNSFLTYFNVEWDIADGDLTNDDIIIEKTIEPSELSGKTVIESICELNGCFGRIGRNGKFQFVHLKQNISGLYPSNTLYPKDDLFPKEVSTIDIGKNTYINCKYEDFKTKAIDKLQIRKEENDVGVVVGDGDNVYVIQDNFLVYGKSENDLNRIANRILRIINKISYRPFDANAIGNPCLETGDVIRLVTRYEMVESYILRRKLKGIQSLKDNYSADGVEELSDKVNSVSNTIVQLKGKANEIERTLDETKSTISDVANDLESKISQTSSKIELEVSRATNKEDELQASITINSEAIEQRVKNNEFESYKTQTANSIEQKVSKGEIVSSINQSPEEIKINAKKISLEGFTSINGNFWIDENGDMHCRNAQVDGDVNAKSFICQDEIKIKESSNGATATVLKVEGNKVTIDPNGVCSLATINTNLKCNKNVDFNSLEHNGSITAYNGNLLIGLYNDSLRPNKDYADSSKLGTVNYYWGNIYSKDGNVQQSDRNLKDNIVYMDDKIEDFFNSLKPCTFKFKNGVRTHFGFISQEVEQSLIDNNMTALDFAGFCKDLKEKEVVDENGQYKSELCFDEDGNAEYAYSLRYSEFISLNTHMIQQANKKIEEQQKEIDELKQSVSFLLEKMERLGL